MQRVAAWAVVIAMVMLTGGGFLGYLIAGRQAGERRDQPDSRGALSRVKVFADQGGMHMPDGEHFTAYNSNPPTSGPHYADPAAWGVYEEEVPDERIVHNLEHCGVWISYRADIPAEEKEKIAAYGNDFPSKMIVSPRAENDAPIALAAWRRLLEMDQFSERDADVFVSAFLNKAGPECNTR